MSGLKHLNQWSACAPSNIALIKYMGKQDHQKNLPMNGSLSLTLNHLCSVVELTWEPKATFGIRWVPESPQTDPALLSPSLPISVPTLSDAGIGKFLKHFERVQTASPSLFSKWGLQTSAERLQKGHWTVRAANTFPAASGIASSASSFAALTLASVYALAEESDSFQKRWPKETQWKRDLAQLSRQGSGSSCRSFEGPWVLWEGEYASALPWSGPKVAHFVMVVKASPKAVSSSEAHQRVLSSPLWQGRVGRVEQKIQAVQTAIAQNLWKSLAQVAWAEAWEMHSLFHTAEKPFTYWEGKTVDVLHWLTPFVEGTIASDFPPIVTLDAGPNIHILVPEPQRLEWKKRIQTQFPQVVLLEDGEGQGAVPFSLERHR